MILQDNVDRKPQDTWVISGKEAEALHMEEEDFSDEEIESDEDEDPLKKIIQSRYLFLFYSYSFNHFSANFSILYSIQMSNLFTFLQQMKTGDCQILTSFLYFRWRHS